MVNSTMAAAPREPLHPGYLSAMAALLGDRLKLDHATREQHGASEAHFATQPPDAVAFPSTTEEVMAIVRLCTASSRLSLWRRYRLGRSGGGR